MGYPVIPAAKPVLRRPPAPRRHSWPSAVCRVRIPGARRSEQNAFGSAEKRPAQKNIQEANDEENGIAKNPGCAVLPCPASGCRLRRRAGCAACRQGRRAGALPGLWLAHPCRRRTGRGGAGLVQRFPGRGSGDKSAGRNLRARQAERDLVREQVYARPGRGQGPARIRGV